jgi:hypothetical protein
VVVIIYIAQATMIKSPHLSYRACPMPARKICSCRSIVLVDSFALMQAGLSASNAGEGVTCSWIVRIRRRCSMLCFAGSQPSSPPALGGAYARIGFIGAWNAFKENPKPC